MNFKRTFLYVILAVLCAAVMGMLLAWNLSKNDTLLIITLVLFVVLILYFIGLLILNATTGWKGENTLRSRMHSSEKFLIYLYPYGKSYVLAAYESTDSEEFIKQLEMQNDNENADMGAFDDVYIGFCKMNTATIASIEKKVIVLSEKTLEVFRKDSSLENFLKKNTILSYPS